MSRHQKPATLKIRVIDKRDGEIANVETDVASLPSHPQYENERLRGVMEALLAFCQANPTLKSIKIEIIGDDDA
jgi:hypothetical protein